MTLRRIAGALALSLLLVSLYSIGGGASSVSAQTCATTTAPATTFGQVNQSVTVSQSGTYRVWSRLKAPSTTNNSYYLQIDRGCAINVGDAAAIPVNSWTWVNYKNGNTTAFIDVTLSGGTHQLTYTGKEHDVQLDRVLLVGNLACVPTGIGDNCASVDSGAPAVSVSAPASGASIPAGSTVTVAANATDNVGVAKVDFYIDGAYKGTDTAAAYAYSWNTTGAAIGTHTLTARAYDAAGNTTTSSAVSVTVRNAAGLTFTPTEDATIAQTYPTTNYGTAGTLIADTSPVRDLLMKFNITGTAGKTIQSAKLRLYTVNGSPDSGGRYYQVGTNWSQGTVTWNTAPAAGAQLTSLPTAAVNSWVEIDVKRLITGDGTFALRANSASASGDSVAFSSREAAANKPELLVTFAADTTVPTVNITTPVSGATISGQVKVVASATDNVGLAKVEFLVDGAVKHADTTAPYEYLFDSLSLPNGSHGLQARAYDAAGNAANSSVVTVNIANPVQNPNQTTFTNAKLVGLNKCLDVSAFGTASGTQMIIWTCYGYTNQRFDFTAAGELRPKHTTGKCVDVAGANTADGTKVQLYTCNGTVAQKWTRTAAGEFRGVGGKCLDIRYAKTANGTNAQLWTCNGTGAQKWTVTP